MIELKLYPTLFYSMLYYIYYIILFYKYNSVIVNIDTHGTAMGRISFSKLPTHHFPFLIFIGNFVIFIHFSVFPRWDVKNDLTPVLRKTPFPPRQETP